ncbi:MAG: D-glycero-beta-D-manno-heptose-7-phosphate kinase [Flavobacteriia bacterium]|nr:D-glycero-beta-D-manno-heptose-7-phosphate kinase [Flavobacteriia bacterium]NBP29066.1 D-glycero-beta-D-manno-heptose-7-phosphate kinase [Flavobacteriia bacterium]
MKLTEVFEGFQNKRIAIVGDVMLDTYIMGKVHRMSPEAPVPILLLNQEDQRLGGAANVALNLKALGAKVFLCSVVGKDVQGLKLIELLQDAGIECSGILQDDSRKTTVKTRVLSGSQHLLRIDQEDLHALENAVAHRLINCVEHLINQGIDALIFEDYNKGVLTEDVIVQCIAFARAHGVVTCVDPKKDHFFSYQNVDLFKPNLKELKDGLGCEINPRSLATLTNASSKLRDRLNHKTSLITLSEFGVFVDDGSQEFIIPAHFRDISDVSGAGDTVIAVATLALCSGLSMKQVAALANLAGGMVCEHSGVVSVNRLELLDEAIKLKEFHE